MPFEHILQAKTTTFVKMLFLIGYPKISPITIYTCTVVQ